MAKNPPYYIIPLIEEYKNGTAEQRQQLAHKIALAIGNPTALRTVLEISPEEYNNFYPDMRLVDPSTSQTIESFIDTFGDPDVKQHDSLDEIITPPTAYSISELEDLPELEPDGSDGIPVFNPTESATKGEPSDKKRAESPAKNTQAESVETLEIKLRELVKSREYQRAIDTIMEINLINPKKSIYFADQIRFLKKLIDLNK